MVNVQYGGRFSNNLISDIVPPETTKESTDDRTGESNFRSFPEIGRNFRRVYFRPAASALTISVREIVSVAKVKVVWKYPKIVKITYIPPVSSFSYVGYADNPALESTTLLKSTSDIFSKITKFLERAK